MRTHESYLRKKARASRKDSEGLGSRQIKCPKCHHDIAIAYDNLTAGNLELYCTVCHSIVPCAIAGRISILEGTEGERRNNLIL